MEHEVYRELSGITLFFVQLMATEILLSFFFIIHNGTVRSTISKKYVSTVRFLIGLFVIVSFIFILGRIFDEQIIEFLIKFEIVLIPMLITSVFFDLFYATKVILRRKWKFKVTTMTLIVFLVFLILSLMMVINDDELLQELQLLLEIPIQEDL